jgi:hypothetical protein
MKTKGQGLKLQVVAPCNEDWDRMSGGDDIRFCGRCRQNVYNLSEMNEAQVRELVQGPACVRFFARGDGTVVTRECTPMLEAARRRMMALAAGLLPLAVGFWGGVAWLRGKVHGERPMMMGAISAVPPPPEPPPAPIMGTPPPPTMGEPVLPEETEQVKPPRHPPRRLMGKPRPILGAPAPPRDLTMGRAAPPPKKEAK